MKKIDLKKLLTKEEYKRLQEVDRKALFEKQTKEYYRKGKYEK